MFLAFKAQDFDQSLLPLRHPSQNRLLRLVLGFSFPGVQVDHLANAVQIRKQPSQRNLQPGPPTRRHITDRRSWAILQYKP